MSVTYSAKHILLLVNLSFSLLTLQSQKIDLFVQQGGGTPTNFEVMKIQLQLVPFGIPQHIVNVRMYFLNNTLKTTMPSFNMIGCSWTICVVNIPSIRKFPTNYDSQNMRQTCQ